jgi:hypothetical protein
MLVAHGVDGASLMNIRYESSLCRLLRSQQTLSVTVAYQASVNPRRVEASTSILEPVTNGAVRVTMYHCQGLSYSRSVQE